MFLDSLDPVFNYCENQNAYWGVIGGTFKIYFLSAIIFSFLDYEKQLICLWKFQLSESTRGTETDIQQKTWVHNVPRKLIKMKQNKNSKI